MTLNHLRVVPPYTVSNFPPRSKFWSIHSMRIFFWGTRLLEIVTASNEFIMTLNIYMPNVHIYLVLTNDVQIRHMFYLVAFKFIWGSLGALFEKLSIKTKTAGLGAKLTYIWQSTYSETCLERPLSWETTCLEGPLVFGRRSHISM